MCRRLAEKLISPNLIPQVGPTGGGDGKTDSDTYPVSTSVSDRWFIPENGWDKDEKWAFAISAKEVWKGKARGDIKKIVDTGREYTRVYFLTNQTPSNKKKKEAQDEFVKEFGVDVVILDGAWILENIYTYDLIDLVVDALNLSEVYKKINVKVGKNDVERSKRLEEIEDKINNSNRYFEYDFQVVEDVLTAAILSRMLERPRGEVEGKFDRAFRFCKKVNNNKQWIRLYYQRAWTYFNWYDDYPAFADDFKSLKKRLSKTSSISEVGLYFNLFNLLRGASASGACDLDELRISLTEERGWIDGILSELIENNHNPCSSLIARTYMSLLGIVDSRLSEEKVNKYLRELLDIIVQSEGFLEYPFDSFKKIIEELGDIFPNHMEFDNLIDQVAVISEKRESELTAGEMFVKRGGQKISAKYYAEGVVYFGKAVMKLAKEETQNGMYLSLRGLAYAYNHLGLVWAANNCLISAAWIAFKSWKDTGSISERMYDCVQLLARNELFVGRVSSFLIWHELFKILSRQVEVDNTGEEISSELLMDACFSSRILNTKDKENVMAIIPDLLELQDLPLSQDSALYKLGYADLVSDECKKMYEAEGKNPDTHFKRVANQPFRDQMIYETNFMSDDKISLSSTILGVKFIFSFYKDRELLLVAETLLAFFESFLATSLSNIYPHRECIIVGIVKDPQEKVISFSSGDARGDYVFRINKFSFSGRDKEEARTALLKFVSQILVENFMIKEAKEYLEKLFKREEVGERVSLVLEHRNFELSVLGDNSKFFLDDWTRGETFKEYPMKRKIAVAYEFDKKAEGERSKHNIDTDRHDGRKVFSVIDANLWDQAKWRGFGFLGDSSGVAAFIAYEDIEAGKKIFDNWIKRFGKEDMAEEIRIAIIKGVDKTNPFWYRVHVSSNLRKEAIGTENLIVSLSRFHEMNARSFQNIDLLIDGYNIEKQFRLLPAQINSDGTGIKPYLDRAILKRTLIVKNAWEVGENDLDSAVIKAGDSPVIPEGVKNPPVFKLLSKKGRRNK